MHTYWRLLKQFAVFMQGILHVNFYARRKRVSAYVQKMSIFGRVNQSTDIIPGHKYLPGGIFLQITELLNRFMSARPAVISVFGTEFYRKDVNNDHFPIDRKVIRLYILTWMIGVTSVVKPSSLIIG